MQDGGIASSVRFPAQFSWQPLATGRQAGSLAQGFLTLDQGRHPLLPQLWAPTGAGHSEGDTYVRRLGPPTAPLEPHLGVQCIVSTWAQSVPGPGFLDALVPDHDCLTARICRLPCSTGDCDCACRTSEVVATFRQSACTCDDRLSTSNQ